MVRNEIDSDNVGITLHVVGKNLQGLAQKMQRERERERERDSLMVTTHSHHSAQAHCQRRGSIEIAAYSGPISLEAFDALRARVVASATGAACLVLRMDRALCLMSSSPVVQGYPAGAVPGAVIVRVDQLDFWTDYARAMAFAGVRRAVFLDSELALCREWVGWQLDASPSSVRRSR